MNRQGDKLVGGSIRRELDALWAAVRERTLQPHGDQVVSRTTNGFSIQGGGGGVGGGSGLPTGGSPGQFLEKNGYGDGQVSWVSHPEHVALEESEISSIDYQPDGKAILRIWTVGGGSSTIAPPPNLRTLPDSDALIFPAYVVGENIFHMDGQDLNVDARIWVVPNEACEWNGTAYITKTVYTIP